MTNEAIPISKELKRKLDAYVAKRHTTISSVLKQCLTSAIENKELIKDYKEEEAVLLHFRFPPGTIQKLKKISEEKGYRFFNHFLKVVIEDFIKTLP